MVLFRPGMAVQYGGRAMTVAGPTRVTDGRSASDETVYALVYETERPRANDPTRNERMLVRATEGQLLDENDPPAATPDPWSNPCATTTSPQAQAATQSWTISRKPRGTQPPLAAAEPPTPSRRRFVPQGGPGLFDQ